ncbi:hypothetical protein [Bradyrhizobium sp. ARR65]|uniref:hypothetical protein n=1 Tax=Bradyrhizobium sp. ARR65 TaxID=1040989 RepID=UPI0018DC09C4|nr:hypothetical protein [Bradyrhizobium sp. ARR65]
MLERDLEKEGQFRKRSGHAIEQARALPSEYAICKNRSLAFSQGTHEVLEAKARLSGASL